MIQYSDTLLGRREKSIRFNLFHCFKKTPGIFAHLYVFAMGNYAGPMSPLEVAYWSPENKGVFHHLAAAYAIANHNTYTAQYFTWQFFTHPRDTYSDEVCFFRCVNMSFRAEDPLARAIAWACVRSTEPSISPERFRYIDDVLRNRRASESELVDRLIHVLNNPTDPLATYTAFSAEIRAITDDSIRVLTALVAGFH